MSNLNRDVLYSIFEQLHDKRTLNSCLLVNKAWCVTAIPNLWRNPWKSLNKENEKLLLNVIFSHLSEVSKNNVGEHNLLTHSYQRPSFDYMSYCRHLNLDEIQRIINENIEDKDKSLKIQNEILNLFINENMKYTHFYMHQNFDHQINLIHGAECCLSGVEFLSCSTSIDDNILTKLTEACKSIKELKLFIELEKNNHGFVKLIEVQRRLYNIDIVRHSYENETFCKILENSLIKHSSTVQHCKITRRPSTKFLSSFVNLKKLELGCNKQIITSWNCLDNLTFPSLKILKSSSVPIETLTSIIKNTSGLLSEIKIDYISHDEISNRNLIQAIYQNCQNIKYLKLLIRNRNILELETLLINCQHLNGLFIIVNDYDKCYWDKLFEILTKSSSTNLFKFKFYSHGLPRLESLKSFFDRWRGRQPMLLQIISDKIIDLKIIERYKAEGIVERYDYAYWWRKRNFDDFEWF
ncbi:hypothetical protein C1646_818098 [Rhizophagus diaphanus]|nr:hypothetical protein C1646_818098 [Rhizophagus diaphanus] [Rhizophagus sp. MUCL 43196]